MNDNRAGRYTRLIDNYRNKVGIRIAHRRLSDRELSDRTRDRRRSENDMFQLVLRSRVIEFFQ